MRGPVEVGTHRQAPPPSPPRPSAPKPPPPPVLRDISDAPTTSIDPQPVVLTLDWQDLAPFRMGNDHQYGALKRLPFVSKMFKFKQADRLFELTSDEQMFGGVMNFLVQKGFSMGKVAESVTAGICLTLSMRWIAEQLQLEPNAERLSNITREGMVDSLVRDVMMRKDDATQHMVAALAFAHGLHHDGSSRDFIIGLKDMTEVATHARHGYFVFGWTGIAGHAVAYTDQGGVSKFFDPNAGEYLLTTSQPSNKARFLDTWHECAGSPYAKVTVYQVWAR